MERIVKFLSEHPDMAEIDTEKGSGETFIISMWSENSSVKASHAFSSQEMVEAPDADAFIFSIFEQLYSTIKAKERELFDYLNETDYFNEIREKEQEANDHN